MFSFLNFEVLIRAFSFLGKVPDLGKSPAGGADKPPGSLRKDLRATSQLGVILPSSLDHVFRLFNHSFHQSSIIQMLTIILVITPSKPSV